MPVYQAFFCTASAAIGSDGRQDICAWNIDFAQLPRLLFHKLIAQCAHAVGASNLIQNAALPFLIYFLQLVVHNPVVFPPRYTMYD